MLQKQFCPPQTNHLPTADTTHSDPIILTHSKVPKITTTRYERRLARKTKRAPVLLSPYTDPTKTKKKPRIERAAETAVGTVSSYVELPIKSNDELKSPIATVEDFNTWLSSDSTKLVDLGTIDAGRAWFKKLMTPNAWADGEDIDTVLYMLRLRMKRSPSSFHKCAITDVMFQQTMEGQWTNKKKDGERYKFDGSVLLPYAEGTYPLNSTSWLDVEKLYAPVNYDNKHWVAAEFDLKLIVCKVYDSFKTMTKPNYAVEKLTGISEILLHLLSEVGIKLKAGAKFRIERVESNVPQQGTDGDCGIFTLKCIECLSSGVPLDTYSHEDIPAIRKKLALDLYNLKLN